MSKKITLMFIISFVFSLSFVIAQGLSVPHQFYGSATFNGAAANGMTVEAYIEGISVGITTTLNGQYGYSPIFLIKDNHGEYGGKTINFHLNGVDTGQTAEFKSGIATRLDLSASGTSSNPPSGNGGGGGGSGGSSSSSSSTTTSSSTSQTTNTDNQDNEDQNEESDLGILETSDNQGSSGITGAVIGTLTTGKGIITLVFIIGIVGMAIILFIVRKRKKSE